MAGSGHALAHCSEKGLTYAPTGGIVAAPTTSLPEEIGGVRNWDYRYCWLRDATFTLFALSQGGYHDEAKAWREWLLRAIAGSPSQMQILYGVRGERRIDEFEIPWLSGYENSRPVRIGNAASTQFQLDVYGEILGAIYEASRAGLEISEADWRLQVSLLNFLETKWMEPDEGIWEVRGPRRHFTHSKVMAWLAFDRGVRMVEEFGFSADGHLERWKQTRDQIHAEVCERGYNEKKKAFTSFTVRMRWTRVFCSPRSPASFRRMMNACAAQSKRSNAICSKTVSFCVTALRKKMWMACPAETAHFCRAHSGSHRVCIGSGKRKKRAPFSSGFWHCVTISVCSPRNMIPAAKRQLGNFPQAFSHIAIITTAYRLSEKR